MKYLNRKYQQGGVAEQKQMQIMQQIAQALQQGKKPEELIQALVGGGMPQDQATQLIQSVIQQMQGSQSEILTAKDGAKLEFIKSLRVGDVSPLKKDNTNVVVPVKVTSVPITKEVTPVNDFKTSPYN